jgi:hypothetical protein
MTKLAPKLLGDICQFLERSGAAEDGAFQHRLRTKLIMVFASLEKTTHGALIVSLQALSALLRDASFIDSCGQLSAKQLFHAVLGLASHSTHPPDPDRQEAKVRSLERSLEVVGAQEAPASPAPSALSEAPYAFPLSASINDAVMPTAFAPAKISSVLFLGTNRRQVRLVGPEQEMALPANAPIPDGSREYYYEITVETPADSKAQVPVDMLPPSLLMFAPGPHRSLPGSVRSRLGPLQLGDYANGHQGRAAAARSCQPEQLHMSLLRAGGPAGSPVEQSLASAACAVLSRCRLSDLRKV